MFKKLLPVLFHIIFWAAFLSVPLFISRPPDIGQHLPAPRDFGQIIIIILIAIFYLNAYFLIPILLNRGRKLIYFISIIILLFAFLIFSHLYIVKLLQGNSMEFPAITGIFPFLFIYALSTSFRIISDKIGQDKKMIEKEKESLQNELNFLRNQISPHFIFNVLNTIASLSRKKSDQIENVVIKLSDIIRYLIYESNTKINLHKEIEHLKNYLDLQQIRFGNEISVNLNIQENIPDIIIEPMLLIPVIENAFKHGNTQVKEPVINIDLSYAINKLSLKVENIYKAQNIEVATNKNGLGLSNIKRRLELLYPSNHIFKYYKENNLFTVELQILL